MLALEDLQEGRRRRGPPPPGVMTVELGDEKAAEMNEEGKIYKAGTTGGAVKKAKSKKAKDRTRTPSTAEISSSKAEGREKVDALPTGAAATDGDASEDDASASHDDNDSVDDEEEDGEQIDLSPEGRETSHLGTENAEDVESMPLNPTTSRKREDFAAFSRASRERDQSVGLEDGSDNVAVGEDVEDAIRAKKKKALKAGPKKKVKSKSNANKGSATATGTGDTGTTTASGRPAEVESPQAKPEEEKSANEGATASSFFSHTTAWNLLGSVQETLTNVTSIATEHKDRLMKAAETAVAESTSPTSGGIKEKSAEHLQNLADAVYRLYDHEQAAEENAVLTTTRVGDQGRTSANKEPLLRLAASTSLGEEGDAADGKDLAQQDRVSTDLDKLAVEDHARDDVENENAKNKTTADPAITLKKEEEEVAQNAKAMHHLGLITTERKDGILSAVASASSAFGGLFTKAAKAASEKITAKSLGEKDATAEASGTATPAPVSSSTPEWSSRRARLAELKKKLRLLGRTRLALGERLTKLRAPEDKPVVPEKCWKQLAQQIAALTELGATTQKQVAALHADVATARNMTAAENWWNAQKIDEQNKNQKESFNALAHNVHLLAMFGNVQQRLGMAGEVLVGGENSPNIIPSTASTVVGMISSRASGATTGANVDVPNRVEMMSKQHHGFSSSVSTSEGRRQSATSFTLRSRGPSAEQLAYHAESSTPYVIRDSSSVQPTDCSSYMKLQLNSLRILDLITEQQHGQWMNDLCISSGVKQRSASSGKIEGAGAPKDKAVLQRYYREQADREDNILDEISAILLRAADKLLATLMGVDENRPGWPAAGRPDMQLHLQRSSTTPNKLTTQTLTQKAWALVNLGLIDTNVGKALSTEIDVLQQAEEAVVDPARTSSPQVLAAMKTVSAKIDILSRSAPSTGTGGRRAGPSFSSVTHDGTKSESDPPPPPKHAPPDQLIKWLKDAVFSLRASNVIDATRAGFLRKSIKDLGVDFGIDRPTRINYDREQKDQNQIQDEAHTTTTATRLVREILTLRALGNAAHVTALAKIRSQVLALVTLEIIDRLAACWIACDLRAAAKSNNVGETVEMWNDGVDYILAAFRNHAAVMLDRGGRGNKKSRPPPIELPEMVEILALKNQGFVPAQLLQDLETHVSALEDAHAARLKKKDSNSLREQLQDLDAKRSREEAARAIQEADLQQGMLEKQAPAIAYEQNTRDRVPGYEPLEPHPSLMFEDHLFEDATGGKNIFAEELQGRGNENYLAPSIFDIRNRHSTLLQRFTPPDEVSLRLNRIDDEAIFAAAFTSGGTTTNSQGLFHLVADGSGSLVQDLHSHYTTTLRREKHDQQTHNPARRAQHSLTFPRKIRVLQDSFDLFLRHS
ncbi:unnamed protein product [Amoebophrya sp. A120]|nr:unnamed protein product [Amoebophrya sp. A120]|eukprot:GSA120T00017584001.1